ncbi:MAG: pyridoxal phosphate-dependent aminotransferase family protein [Bacteroidia bacterium]|nr:pyridoxal phosphate-dependent aminotransferase family protein [Bacteroidia bacterium]MDW8301029.1 pyridoxal phosphate-dependent aminotransferase family protein [Bacteroidia bacterium]
MQKWLSQIEKQIHQLKVEQEYRTLQYYNQIDFISNDYLGIVKKGILQKLMLKELSNGIPLGSTGSRLLSGNSIWHQEAEDFFKEYFDCADALIVNSAYDANVAVLSTFPSRKDIILYDEKVHASIKEGMRLSFASRYPVKHNDMNDLEKKIKKYRESIGDGQLFYVFETVYSMDGDVPEVQTIIKLAQQYEVILIADEVHAFGVFGDKGQGLLQMYNCHKNISIRIIGFGKAGGTFGAVIAVQDSVIKAYLLNKARPVIYTTALSPFQVRVMHAATQLIAQNSNWRADLHFNIQVFQHLLPHLNIQTPIIPIVIGDLTKLHAIHETVKNAGFDVAMVRSPTVPKGQERLRISVHAHNTKQEIEEVLGLIQTCLT